jgi:hypothetical protein
MASSAQQALIVGLADAVGFTGGALAGWGLGRLLGLDVLATGGFDAPTVLAWALLLTGCGAGKWASERLKRRLQPPSP